MTLRTRRKIFYTLVAIFFVLGTGVVLYAQGWRLDFSTWRFEKIGGIYVRSYPEGVSLFLNGKTVANQSGFLSPGTLISDLLPKTYTVSLEASGYDAWKENAIVLPALVTQFKYAVLVPSIATTTPSSTARAISLANATAQLTTSTLVDQFNTTQKIVLGQNKISIFDTAQATTTATIAISGKTISAKWIAPNLIGILQNSGELYIYDTDTQSPQKLADDVSQFAATDDGSMVAALEYHSLEIFSLNDSSIYYRFNLPNIADAENLTWYKDRAHLFIIYPNHVSFLDLADSDLSNFINVANGTSPFYDPSTNTFYITETSGKSSVKTIVQYAFPN